MTWFPLLLALALLLPALWLGLQHEDRPEQIKPRKPSGVTRRGKDVYILGRPVEIMPLEEFKVVLLPQGCTGDSCEWCRWYVNAPPSWAHPPEPVWEGSAFFDLYASVVLEGLLLRGICG